MVRELLLLRHGKSDWNTTTDDFHRPLKDRGKRGAQRIGVWLRQQGLVPDRIISSPAKRAIDTAKKSCKAMGRETAGIEQNTRLYGADINDFKHVLKHVSTQPPRILLVGHNPGLENLLLHLTGGNIPSQEDAKLLPTATLARLKMPDNWKTLNVGCAILLSITRASSLPERFPIVVSF